ncbi:RNA polymerase sigma factor [Mariniblastus fucicola]|uniref:ECF sigma factor n=1 Tax=Mariniblastus fucicola TaxID=980251 RepID=A0A5B9PC13_9BACT|nr:ECF-type sigma factor [Mariniblastus fucicola]QEG22590.1 ECF sigma factor [Mariniblastus fucicola]
MTDPPPGSSFNTTCWHVVTSSQDQDSAIRRQSLSELYQAYWYPLFAYLRRKGHSQEVASDYVQGFFLELIDKDFLAAVSPEKGRFRWFMMSAIGRYVGKQNEKQNAQKRGGGKATFSLDVEKAEQRYQQEPIEDWTPEKLFERRWALEVLSKALEMLRSDHESRGKLELYRELQATLAGETLTGEACDEIGARLEMSPVAVKVSAHRLKEKYRKALVDVVSQTLTSHESVDDELDKLFDALAG